MTYIEFRDKYNGKYLDYDKSYGNQCWDLAQYYFTECLGLPSSVLSGCGLVSNMLYPPKREELDKYFYEVSPTAMKQGDVVIWEYGHISIYDSWDGQACWFFSQNYPLKSNSHLLIIDEPGIHAFRLKKQLTPNVERDESKNQLEVKIDNLRVRTSPSLNGEFVAFANIGFYDYFDVKEVDGYTWYKIADDQWIAYNEEWETVYPKKEEEYIQLKVLDKKDDYVLVNLGEIYIKK